MTPIPALADLTTLRVGGAAEELIVAETEADLIEAVRRADAGGQPVLVLGGGSNVVVDSDGFAGTVVLVRTRGIEARMDACSGAWISVAAGEPWDDVVSLAVEREWIGIEALAGIPGLTGATPMQNVGAYGQEVARVIARVRAYDRRSGDVVTLAAGDCGFGYRTSLFKAAPECYVLLSVDFQLPLGSLGAPIRYAELARALEVELDDRVPAARVRETVLELRRGKGMVLDADDHDTWSVGSFFTNPVVDAARVPAGAPTWPQEDGTAKTSAAWLVEHAGFVRGYRLSPDAPAALSSKHTLAITNRGRASSDDILALARAVRDGVRENFGITLVPEPTLVGCTLD